MAQVNCPKCSNNHILLSKYVADRGANDMRALHAAIVPASNNKYLVEGAGALSSVICRSCGYTEFYVADAGAIPIDGVIVREIVGPETKGPFR